MFKGIILALLCGWCLPASAVVILQYHHVSEDTPSVTSVTPAQFKAQMAFIKENEFTVLPLEEVVASIKNGDTLPDKALAITFDDGYASIADNAHPILKAYGFPYTIFIGIDPIESGYRDIMSWDTLRALSEDGVALANHSWAHDHLIRQQEDESQAQWLSRVEKDLLDTEAEIKAQTGQSHRMLAYPYGEYNLKLEGLLEKHGFVGFGQQSGAAGAHSSLTALPRFPVAGVYADMASLKVKFYSLNMPVLDMSPKNTQLAMGNWRPELKVKLDMHDIYPHQMMCYIQGQGAKKPQWISESEFSIQADMDLPAGRSRYNCTAPSKTSGRYYWFSQAWVRPKNDGTWVAE